MAPTHVKLVTNRCPQKSVEVRASGVYRAQVGSRYAAASHLPRQINLEEHDKMSEVKRKLERVTGIPAAEMKVRLGGYNQMVMLDTTTNVRVGTCGVTRGALFAHSMVSWLTCASNLSTAGGRRGPADAGEPEVVERRHLIVTAVLRNSLERAACHVTCASSRPKAARTAPPFETPLRKGSLSLPVPCCPRRPSGPDLPLCDAPGPAVPRPSGAEPRRGRS